MPHLRQTRKDLDRMHKKPWFIYDQRWSVLTATFKKLDFLNPEYMRPGKIIETTRNEQWQVFQRDELVFNRPSVIDASGKAIDFRLVAITSDAGMGKSNATEWLRYRINHPAQPPREAVGQEISRAGQQLAFRILLDGMRIANGKRKGTVKIADVDSLINEIVSDWSNTCKLKHQPIAPNHLKSFVATMLRTGAICLIFDGLDQANEQSIQIVRNLIEAEETKHCRFYVAGRPNAIRSKWELLFEDLPWSYVQVEDFSRAQQVRYLGWLPNGQLRYRAIDRDARPILSIPRVLSYLRNKDHFDQIRTAADVYYDALKGMIREGLQGLCSENERIDQSLVKAILQTLAIIAFETIRVIQGESSVTFRLDRTGEKPILSTTPSRPEAEPLEYKFDLAATDPVAIGKVDEVRRRTRKRHGTLDLGWDFDVQIWPWIGALNTRILDQGIFDDCGGRFDQILWSNKSIHEFLLAYYYAQLSDPDDCDRLWDWIYLSDNSTTDKYYQFWQFLCEMPDEARYPLRWLNAIELLYWPSICDPSYIDRRKKEDPNNPISPFFSKRSTEFIYRSWTALNNFATSGHSDDRNRANDILTRWLNEFKNDFLESPKWGLAYQKTAEQIIGDLLFVPGGEFSMGTTLEKQKKGFIDQDDEEFIKFRDPENVKRWFDDRLFYSSRAGKQQREILAMKWVAAARSGNYQKFLEVVDHIGNADRVFCEVDNYLLSRETISNQKYRLFSADHGIQIESQYHEISATKEHPAIRISFFDAWAFSKWLHWEAESCRLPWENEWEYAAKYGFSDNEWDQLFWWGDEFDVERHIDLVNCKEADTKATLIPDSRRASPASFSLDPLGDRPIANKGLMDMLGNVWEWCQDEYRFKYRNDLRALDSQCNSIAARSLRGGAFDYYYFGATCSRREVSVPAGADNNFGFRIARNVNSQQVNSGNI